VAVRSPDPCWTLVLVSARWCKCERVLFLVPLPGGLLFESNFKSRSKASALAGHAAAVTSRHVCRAQARNARCVLAEIRWRWTLKVANGLCVPGRLRHLSRRWVSAGGLRRLQIGSVRASFNGEIAYSLALSSLRGSLWPVRLRVAFFHAVPLLARRLCRPRINYRGLGSLFRLHRG
jgi:hypothetical protein